MSLKTDTYLIVLQAKCKCLTSNPYLSATILLCSAVASSKTLSNSSYTTVGWFAASTVPVKPCGGREEPGITLFRFLGGVEAEAALDEVFRFRDARNECRSAE